MILEKIVEQKRLQLKEEMQQITIEGWKNKVKGPGLHKPLDFMGAIKRPGEISIIAEVKKASPSKGIIRAEFDPVDIASQYCKTDIQAISVLTEKHFFLGSDENLRKVRQIAPVPVLRKDFIIDLWQVYQSRVLGADAILLIAAILDEETLKKLMIVTNILGMQCLVEVHDERELETALRSGARMIGINNRNLHTFEVDLSTTARLIEKIPNGLAVVSESGISGHGDIRHLKELGVDAVLIGETLMRAGSISEKVLELRGVSSSDTEQEPAAAGGMK
jgi:indole-3-glycerol phosphate synthase